MTRPIARRSAIPVAGLLLMTLGTAGLQASGLLANTPTVTAVAAFALLVFGLPHGAFDLALLRRARGVRAGSAGSEAGWSLAMASLYVGCAALMYLAWRIGPIFALSGFLLMAVAHFAEDWEDCGSRFIACGIAVAILSAPSLLHGDSLRALFVLLTGDAGAAVLADVLLLVAPTAMAVAGVGVVLLWQAGRHNLAIAAGSALAAMLLLPPVIGFALFFCLVHSPIQFRHHADSLGLQGFGEWRGTVVPLSFGGFGVAVAVYLLNGAGSIAAGVFASSFMTLSILTVPHMLVPMLAGRVRQPALA